MNVIETGELLTVISELDSRRFTRETVKAWAMVLSDYSADECLAAVQAHFTESEDWLRPNHISTQVRKARKARLGAVTRIEVADVDDRRGPGASQADFDAYRRTRTEVLDAVSRGWLSRESYQAYLGGSMPWSEFRDRLRAPDQLTG